MKTDYDVFKESGNGDVITSGVPKASADQMYSWSVFNSIAQLERVFASLENVTDPRPLLLVRQVIAHVVDDKIRADLFRKLDEKIAEIDRSNQDNDIKAQNRLYVANLICGEVLSWLDQSIGIYEQNVIAFFTSEEEVYDESA